MAENYGSKAVGVVLTGNLNDGTLDPLEIKRCGGAVGQDPKDAANPEIPRSAAAHVNLEYCLPLAEMPELLIEMVKEMDGKEAVIAITPSQPDAEQAPEIISGRTFERPPTITCPECGGARKRSEAGSIIKLAATFGRSNTAEVMASAQFDELESYAHRRVVPQRAGGILLPDGGVQIRRVARLASRQQAGAGSGLQAARSCRA